jgi:hypothetical protein
VDFPVENSVEKYGKKFVLHSRWILFTQVAGAGSGQLGELSTGQSTSCAQLCDRFSTGYPQGRVGTGGEARQNVRALR